MCNALLECIGWQVGDRVRVIVGTVPRAQGEIALRYQTGTIKRIEGNHALVKFSGRRIAAWFDLKDLREVFCD